MNLHLCWLDKNWMQRGYAKNYHLYIDFSVKVYNVVTNYMMIPSGGNHIEVKRKSDIDDYIEILERDGFTKSQVEALRA